VVVLPELGLQYALATWLVARLTGAVHWVDHFVGMYETNILDWRERSPRSPKALAYLAGDWLSSAVADVVTSDTDVRVERLRRHAGRRTRFFTLPVGAPHWAAQRSRPRGENGRQTVLFYGNYLPLHGVPLILDGFARVVMRDSEVVLRMIGDGRLRAGAEDYAAELGLAEAVDFVDPVSADVLAAALAEADVVLGVFGESPKAATVIANKVWQGLAAERPVLTRESPALDEIREAVGGWLIEVEAGSPEALAEALTSALRESPRGPQGVADELERYVARRYDAFFAGLFVRSPLTPAMSNERGRR